MAGQDEKAWGADFDAADADGNGFLTIQELATLMRSRGSKMSDQELCNLFIELGGAKSPAELVAFMADPDNRITRDKYVKSMTKRAKRISDAKALFKDFDTDNSGKLEMNEVKQLIKSALSLKTDAEAEEIAKDIMNKDDTDNDGKLSESELLACLS